MHVSHRVRKVAILAVAMTAAGTTFATAAPPARATSSFNITTIGTPPGR